ncbi:MAG: 30S ribosomal protein S6, partial [Ruminococcus sp.]|nr:30S ribosomal protein S6 [Ruminococcus sp.]
DWGKRKLAYPIEDETEGYYVIYTFESKPDYPAELSRRLNITDGVLRSLVTVM